MQIVKMRQYHIQASIGPGTLGRQVQHLRLSEVPSGSLLIVCRDLFLRSVAPRLNSAKPDSGISCSRARSDFPRRRVARCG